MGSRGLGAFRGMLLGSVSDEVGEIIEGTGQVQMMGQYTRG